MTKRIILSQGLLPLPPSFQKLGYKPGYVTEMVFAFVMFNGTFLDHYVLIVAYWMLYAII